VKRTIVFLPLLITFAAVVGVHSQVGPPDNRREQQRLDTERKIEAERELRMRQMRELDTRMKAMNQPDRSVPATPTIDKETSERIRLARRVEAADFNRYSEFLNTGKTGIFKLFPDYDCVTKDVVRTDGECKNFVFASSSFSFRTGGYIHPYYHDFGFNHGEIYSNAFFSQGILVSLGDVPIESVTPSRDELKFVFDFQPASDPDGARKSAVRLKDGIESGGFNYSSHFLPGENTTYVLRSIAYDIANALPAVTETTSMSELRFHTLARDKRADVVILFRIVRKGPDGSLTIVWKELDRKEAPKIKFSKGDKFVDFKPDLAQSQH